MANEIQLYSLLSFSNGLPPEQPQQLQITQTTYRHYSDIVTVAVAGAGTTLQGWLIKPSAVCATTAALAANTYANGASGVGATLTADANGALGAIDGVTPVVNEVILVKNESSGLKNGLYTVTQVGDGSNPFILTRVTGMDTTGEFVGATFWVSGGSTNGGISWNCTNTSAPTVGTTSITFAKSTTGTALAYGSIEDYGVAYIRNEDDTNFVLWGPAIGGAIQPVGKLKAGEEHALRLHDDVGRPIHFLADTAAVKLYYRICND